MSNQNNIVAPVVDIVISVYGERSEALPATLSACANQTYRMGPHSSPRIFLLRLPQNQGISAARNAAIAFSNATFIACINTEVLPDPDWLDTCLQYMHSQPRIGACYTRSVPRGRIAC